MTVLGGAWLDNTSAYAASGIERAADSLPAALQHVRVDHRGADVLVAQEFLHGTNIITIFQQMGGKTVPIIPRAE
jgi:hypothetical protein